VVILIDLKPLPSRDQKFSDRSSGLWLNFAIGAAIGGVSGASGELLQAGADAAWGKYGSSISIESTHNSPQSPI